MPSRSLTSAKCDFLAKALKNQHYCQNTDFTEDGLNGVYANLGIHSIFAKPYNARAKVIERFFREFQEEFEKLMPGYIGKPILQELNSEDRIIFDKTVLKAFNISEQETNIRKSLLDLYNIRKSI